MSKTIEISDEQYQTIERAAAARGQTSDALLAQMIDELRDPHTNPRSYETDDWLRHLGVSEERIRDANARLRAAETVDADAC